MIEIISANSYSDLAKKANEWEEKNKNFKITERQLVISQERSSYFPNIFYLMIIYEDKKSMDF